MCVVKTAAESLVPHAVVCNLARGKSFAEVSALNWSLQNPNRNGMEPRIGGPFFVAPHRMDPMAYQVES